MKKKRCRGQLSEQRKSLGKQSRDISFDISYFNSIGRTFYLCNIYIYIYSTYYVLCIVLSIWHVLTHLALITTL
jgi:hypothetical protein